MTSHAPTPDTSGPNTADAAPVRLSVGDVAPDFDLPASGGGRIALSDLRGAPAILWFYPGANTPLCTTQACGLRDEHELFDSAGYQVLGISPDPVPELDRFVSEQHLPYPLASDETHEVMAAYGAWGPKNMYGRIVTGTIRSTIVLDAAGTITWLRYRVPTPSHVTLLRGALNL